MGCHCRRVISPPWRLRRRARLTEGFHHPNERQGPVKSVDRGHKVQHGPQGCSPVGAWIIGSVATESGGLALGDFADDKADAGRQQQGRRSGHLLVYLPYQPIGANTDFPSTFQHLPLRMPDLSRQRLGSAWV